MEFVMLNTFFQSSR